VDQCISQRQELTNMRLSGTKRILVTGGAGFLGSHLCERLIAAGHEVICVDNCYTGSKINVRGLLDNPLFEFIRHDVTFPLYIEVDEIYNLACPASPIHYQFDPVQTIKTSVHGAINMLGLAKRVKAKILQASTSEVYGDPAVHPTGGAGYIGSHTCKALAKAGICGDRLYCRARLHPCDGSRRGTRARALAPARRRSQHLPECRHEASTLRPRRHQGR
jgi:nucleoside-diphosphate-sugar epimerase